MEHHGLQEMLCLRGDIFLGVVELRLPGYVLEVRVLQELQRIRLLNMMERIGQQVGLIHKLIREQVCVELKLQLYLREEVILLIILNLIYKK